jgi:tetratricopeptide (TPR) repeat protein
MADRTTRHWCFLRIATSLLCALLASTGCRAVSTGRNVDGVRYFQQGQYPVAIQRFDSALTIDPKNPDSYYNKGAVLHRTGLATKDQNALNQAESLYRQCLAYNPNHVDCHRGLAVLLTETNRTSDAFTLLRNWATVNPQSSDARVELARLYEEYNDPRAAETYLTEALTLNPRDWRAHAALGRLKEQAGDYSQALVNYQRAQQINRFQPELGQRIASLQAKAPAVPPTGAATTAGGATTAAGAAPPGSPRSAAAPRAFRNF